MTTYHDIWNAMNELDLMTSKLGYIKEMMEISLEHLDNDKSRAESLMFVSCDYIKYYLEEHDRNFKNAWTISIKAGRELEETREQLSKLTNVDNIQETVSNTADELNNGK